MSANLISMLLWAPFAIVVIVSGIIFCICGYKKGLYRALFALGATIVSALVSLLLARLLSGLIAPAIMKLLPLDSASNAGISGSIVATLASGFIKMAVALVLYPIFMFILTIVLRIVSARIKKEMFTVSDDRMRWGGLAVGGVCAILYTFLLLLPLYGSLGTYIPTIKAIYSLSNSNEKSTLSAPVEQKDAPVVTFLSNTSKGYAFTSTMSIITPNDPQGNIPEPDSGEGFYVGSGEDLQTYLEQQAQKERAQEQADTTQLLGAVSNHPIVRVSGSPVFSGFYGMLTSVDVGEASIDPAQVLKTIEKLVNSIMALQDADETNIQQKVQTVVTILDKEILNTGWFYDLSMEVLSQLETHLASAEPEVRELLANALGVLTCSKKDFDENCTHILNFISHCLENDIITVMDNEDYAALYDRNIILEAGKLANCTDEAVAMKELILRTLLPKVQNLQIGMITDPQQQVQEAESFLLIMGFGNATPAEVIARHPSLGPDALPVLIEQLGFGFVFDLDSAYQADALAIFEADPAKQELLIAKAKECAANPLGEPSLGDYLQEVSHVASFAQEGEFYYGYNAKAEPFLFALEVLGQEAFEKGSLTAGKETYQFFRTMLLQIQKDPSQIIVSDPFRGEYSEDFMDSVVAAAKLMSAAKEGNLPHSMDEYVDNYNLDMGYLLGRMIFDESGYLAVRQLVDEKGTDPFDLGGYLTSEQKDTVYNALVKMTGEEYLGESNAQNAASYIAKANYLLKFFGIRKTI